MSPSRFLKLATAAFVVLTAASIAKADLVPAGTINISGTCLGYINKILSFQGTSQGMGLDESGCVGVSSAGVLNSTGSSVCQGGKLGGDEKAPAGFPENT